MAVHYKVDWSGWKWTKLLKVQYNWDGSETRLGAYLLPTVKARELNIM